MSQAYRTEVEMKNRKSPDTAVIYELPRSLLPEIADRLNQWEWHSALGEEPAGWQSMTKDEKHKIIHPFMLSIEVTVGKKALLRYHHKHNLGETNQHFEDWWDSIDLTDELLEKTDCDMQ